MSINNKARKHRLMREYGLTPETYQLLADGQSNACGLCYRPPFNEPYKVLSVDHDHDTGNVRGLLCHGCNLKLGWYEKHRQEIEAWVSQGRYNA